MLWTNNQGEGRRRYGFLRRRSSSVFLIVVALLGMIAACTKNERQLVIEHEREGETFLELPVEPGDEVALSWVHSVEKTPWTDFFIVGESCDLLLEETQFESFGAGVEHEYEDLKQRDGKLTAQNIQECHTTVNWIHSHDAEYHVKLNKEVVAAAKDLPHHEPLRMFIEKR
ncbi:DUF1850 domain-containing protein [Salibacterium aidingense]|uniref:DUF1850 domain-containing protein n=1 Tax=Salibacterium aidingense TaxID=384933 RepID=UPI000686036B|nr:DUF1850 domain-containing protein [Salibacterium aidingense]